LIVALSYEATAPPKDSSFSISFNHQYGFPKRSLLAFR